MYLHATRLGPILRAMIKSFADKETEAVWEGSRSRLPNEIQRRAVIRLLALNTASSVEALRSPLGNRLEKLCDDRAGQHSIRINDQWRICFRWEGTDAYRVEITDYH
jgi:proteic killer suppression protein